jgi:hypothetical protein
MRRAVVGILFGLAAAGYTAYRVMKHVAARLMEDCLQVLRWLAWRDPRLAHYDPPASGDKAHVAATTGPHVDALVVHGCSMVSVPLSAADLFVDVLHPAGCRTVVLTGGVGRETLPLWSELVARDMCTLFRPSGEGWSREETPEYVALPSQGVARKPVLAAVDLEMPPEELRQYASEADVFLEIFLARCRERGMEARFAGNPMARQPTPFEASFAAVNGGVRVFLETASTHTGTNVSYSLATLKAVGLQSPAVAVVQQPQLHMRTCLTWEMQTGVRPVGWTLRPTEAATGRSISEMLTYALGEVRRIPAYSCEEKGFCVMPDDFPTNLIQSLATLEPAFVAAMDLEKKAKAR